MIAAIHQPECFPWLGFIDKALRADVFILLDDVQFEKNYFQNRNRIRTADGWIWLTVPVAQKGRSLQRLLDVAIAGETNPRWIRKHLASWTQCYSAAPHARRHLAFLESLYAREWKWLVDFNIEIIAELFAAFGVRAKLLRSSQMKSEGTATRKLLTLCQDAGASAYLSGVSGKDYLQEGMFAQAGLQVLYQEFHHPVYEQVNGGFEPCMTSFDLLFNQGPRSREILASAENRLAQVFL